MSNYVCIATPYTYDGPVTFYYTGKAGDDYASTRLNEAFTYNTEMSAQTRCNNLNRGSKITKLHWTVKEMK
jgi:hypothetical protein